jgi:hypothetical protein
MKSILAPLFLLSVVATAAHAQISYLELESNDSKAFPNFVPCLVAGDSVTGSTTGTSTTVPGPASADTFVLQTCALPTGLYLHRLTLTTTGPAGHIGSIRGLSQTAGVPNPGTDSLMQAAVTTTTPARMNAWYGFGAMEQIYYRVTGTASTTDSYVATLSTSTVATTPIPGSFTPGTITISTVGQTTQDTEIYVYDSNFQPVPTAHNDDSTGTQSMLARNFGAGVYYLVISDWNIANNIGDANVGENAVSQVLLDFPNALCVRDPDSGIDLDFTISDGVTTLPITATKPAPFEALFYTFTVGTPVVFEAFCTNGSLGSDHTTPCPCGNVGAPGNGCGHSFDSNGANMSATGSAANDDVVLHSQFEPVSSFTLMMQHANTGDSIFHDGVLCAANPLIRLRGRSAVAGEAFFPNSNFAQDSTTTLSIRGGTFPGSGATMRYAAWYRNASSTFCPPATANVTNGWMVVW